MATAPPINLLVIAGLVSASALVWLWISARRIRGMRSTAWEGTVRETYPLAAALLALPLSLGVQAVVAGTWSVDGDDPSSLAHNLRVDCLARGAAWGSLLLAALAVGQRFAAAPGFAWKRLAFDAGAGALTALAAFGPVLAINVVVARSGWKDPEALHPLLVALQADPARLLPWVAVSAALLAPLHEELLYRLLIQGALQPRIGAGAAIAASTFLFCAGHLAPGRPDGLALVPLALLLGWLFARSGSYAAVVTAHALFNAINLGLALLPNAA